MDDARCTGPTQFTTPLSVLLALYWQRVWAHMPLYITLGLSTLCCNWMRAGYNAWSRTARKYSMSSGCLVWISQLMGRVQIGISNMFDHLVSEELFEELKRCLYHHKEFKYWIQKLEFWNSSVSSCLSLVWPGVLKECFSLLCSSHGQQGKRCVEATSSSMDWKEVSVSPTCVG